MPPEHCSECGFDATTVTPTTAEASVRALGRRYQAPLTRLLPGEDADVVLRRRPGPTTWSALEYAAHMRDVIALWGWGLHQALTNDEPELSRPDPDIADRTAAEESYNEQDPSTVANDLSANADRMADKVATITPLQWDRGVSFGGERISVLAIVQKVAHEGRHHLLDIGRSLRAVRSGES